MPPPGDPPAALSRWPVPSKPQPPAQTTTRAAQLAVSVSHLGIAKRACARKPPFAASRCAFTRWLRAVRGGQDSPSQTSSGLHTADVVLALRRGGRAVALVLALYTLFVVTDRQGLRALSVGEALPAASVADLADRRRRPRALGIREALDARTSHRVALRRARSALRVGAAAGAALQLVEIADGSRAPAVSVREALGTRVLG